MIKNKTYWCPHCGEKKVEYRYRLEDKCFRYKCENCDKYISKEELQNFKETGVKIG